MTDDEFKFILTKMVSEVAPKELQSYPAWDHVIYLTMTNLLRDHPGIMEKVLQESFEESIDLFREKFIQQGRIELTVDPDGNFQYIPVDQDSHNPNE